MAFGYKIKKQDVENRLLEEIFRLKDNWMQIKMIIEKSVEPSEIALYDLKVAETKYFYLLREARHRKISARH
ncbi:YaaL family protein [Paraliobacillus sediminis]|uniref:YaaL family protein n=1 Tax=Paraliobacillus sediminis TaxID=1885916 RepID=UPI000E3BA1F6|nr:YaaL family protein [Paraliobacillus sediminis]